MPDQMADLFEAAKGSDIYTPIILAGLLGLRRSEIVALEWSSLDLKKGTISIQRKAIRDYEKKENIISNRLKTDSSYRTLCLPENLITFLKRERKLQLKRLSENKNHVKSYKDFICVQQNGELLSLTKITNTFRRFMKKSSMPIIRFHDLRHSCASMLLYLGYNMKQIQMWMGHSNFETTANIYTHVDINEKVKMANKICKSISLDL